MKEEAYVTAIEKCKELRLPIKRKYLRQGGGQAIFNSTTLPVGGEEGRSSPGVVGERLPHPFTGGGIVLSRIRKMRGTVRTIGGKA